MRARQRRYQSELVTHCDTSIWTSRKEVIEHCRKGLYTPHSQGFGPGEGEYLQVSSVAPALKITSQHKILSALWREIGMQ